MIQYDATLPPCYQLSWIQGFNFSHLLVWAPYSSPGRLRNRDIEKCAEGLLRIIMRCDESVPFTRGQSLNRQIQSGFPFRVDPIALPIPRHYTRKEGRKGQCGLRMWQTVPPIRNPYCGSRGHLFKLRSLVGGPTGTTVGLWCAISGSVLSWLDFDSVREKSHSAQDKQTAARNGKRKIAESPGRVFLLPFSCIVLRRFTRGTHTPEGNCGRFRFGMSRGKRNFPSWQPRALSWDIFVARKVASKGLSDVCEGKNPNVDNQNSSSLAGVSVDAVYIFPVSSRQFFFTLDDFSNTSPSSTSQYLIKRI